LANVDGRIFAVVALHILRYATQLKKFDHLSVARFPWHLPEWRAYMPIMAANAQSDARGAAWLLASAAGRCIDQPEHAAEWQEALNNTYRLLEAFRHNLLFALRPPRAKRHAVGDVEMLTMVPASERHLSEVRDAITEALAVSFQDIQKEDAIEQIASVLRAIAAPTRFSASDEHKKKARQFFVELLKRLDES
jgi:hypothetical protein